MKKFSSLLLSLVVLILATIAILSPVVSAEDSVASSTYNTDVAQKLTSRCGLIKDYLSQTARINDLAARQNKVRGWEYILRRLKESKSKYEKFEVSFNELEATLEPLNQQLEQFKVDFETYDSAFQRLQSIDCEKQPENFWSQLQTLRAFRTGISLAAENFKASLSQVLAKEEVKW